MSDHLPESPWLFPYVDLGERTASGEQRNVHRPAVEVSLVGPGGATPWAFALVDSGSEHTLAGPWVPQTVGVLPTRELEIGIGGRSRLVRFTEVTLRVRRFGSDQGEFIEWQTDVGFFDTWEPPWAVLLGQRGFFDRFTITMQRAALSLALERPSAFDERFGPLVLPKQ